MTGAANALFRRVVLDARPGVCRAWLEDNFHHFAVTLEHDGQRVTRMQSQGLRTPWTLCAQATELLQQLHGQPLPVRMPKEVPGMDSKLHCTHQYDLALLAFAHAQSGQRTEYLARVAQRVQQGGRCALWHNTELLLDWTLQGTRIESNDECHGQDLRGVMAWAHGYLAPDKLAALYVLRRAILVSGGVGVDLDQFDHAGQLMKRMAGGCYVFQATRAEQALRVQGSSRTDLDGFASLLPECGPPATVI